MPILSSRIRPFLATAVTIGLCRGTARAPSRFNDS